MSALDAIAVILSTCPVAQADELARLLVEKRLAACVNVVPKVSSFYFWEGELQRDDESLLVVKCRRQRVAALTAELVRAHPYDVPEVVALDVTAGSEAYLRWVAASTDEG